MSVQNTASGRHFAVCHVGYALWVQTLHVELSLKKMGRTVAFVRSVFLYSNVAL
jgi:hypothetical protein